MSGTVWPSPTISPTTKEDTARRQPWSKLHQIVVDWEEATLEAADKEDKVEAIVDETEEIVEDAAVAAADEDDKVEAVVGETD